MTSRYRKCPIRTLCLLPALVGCTSDGGDTSGNRDTTTTLAASVSADTRGSAVADDGQWVMPARNYASTRFSGLTEITTDNVGTLRPAWSFSTGVQRGHEAAPLVVGSMMYVVTPFPNLLHAFDLTKPCSGTPCTMPRLHRWGLTPLEDQQLAGVIMWVPAGLSYLIAALGLSSTWLREPGARPVFQPSPLP